MRRLKVGAGVCVLYLTFETLDLCQNSGNTSLGMGRFGSLSIVSMHWFPTTPFW